MMIFSFFLILFACVCLCLSLSKHFKDLVGGRLDERRKTRLRVLGYGALIPSIALAFLGDGYIGLVYWFGLFSLVSMPIAFLLPYVGQSSFLRTILKE